MTEQVTMADLRKTCEERLDYAIEYDEKGLNIVPGVKDVIFNFETPAGLLITRYAGSLSIDCDLSNLEGGALHEIRIEFFEDEETPEVFELVSNRSGYDERTVKKANHDRVAAELSKYINPVP
ncbi:MAG TPA: hypothetical protein VFK03_03530 [Candidatus Saccharimonadales bacterium]|nr:hypothetical protein [Candidatus Saccharimonadales bacterium]